MLKTTPVFLIFLLSLSHYVTCDEFEDNREQWLQYLAQRMGSCSRYFQYLRTGDFINGKLTLPNIKIGDTVKLTFNQENSAHSVLQYPKYDGIFLPVGSPQEVINRLQKNQPISYRVDFPFRTEVQELIKIFINGNELCETRFKNSSGEILILQHTLNIINESLPVFTYNMNLPHFAEEPNESCGLIDTQIAINGVTPLAYGGTFIIRGEYPWLTAIYQKRRTGLAFICGGSLVTSKIILSAAHCFLGLNLTPEKITAILGRYNLTNSMENGFVRSEIEAITLHPDYRHVLGFSDADLALLEMKEHVSFTKFIQPICLWSESAEESKIVNQIGVVVGWGSSEDGYTISAVPKKVNIKIVSGEECLRSSLAFHAVTSSRTLCAGYRNGSGPCEGDSGGGLVLNRNGVWILRGVISLALTIQQRCDLQEYTVYCDAAKHMSWLQNYITQRQPTLAGSVNDICGRSGTESRNEHPWLVAIYRKVFTGVSYDCTGVLVSQRSVISSASCFVLRHLIIQKVQYIRIYLGRYDLNNMKEQGVVSRDITTLIFHPEFEASGNKIEDNNIAILQMKDPVRFTRYVKPICLWREPMDQSKIVGQFAALLSWKPSNETLTVPTSIEVNISSLEECQLLGFNVSTASHTLCITRFSNNTEGILMLERNGRWLLRGVSSWSYNYKSENFSVYADIAEYRSWIQSNILS